MGKPRLILYDTCNYRDYPVGGQVTSIKNFLRFLSQEYPEHTGEVLLVGVSCDASEVGKVKRISTGGGEYSFLAVTQASADLSKVKKSLRLEYVKGLWKYRKLIGLTREDCNYIHTPEPSARYVFSGPALFATYFPMGLIWICGSGYVF